MSGCMVWHCVRSLGGKWPHTWRRLWELQRKSAAILDDGSGKSCCCRAMGPHWKWMGIAAFFAAALGLVWSQLRLRQFSLDSPLPPPIWSSLCGPATKSLLFILTLPLLQLFNVTKCASRQSHPRNHWPFILTAEPHLFWPVTSQITCQLTTRLLDYGTVGPNAGTDTLGRWRYIWRLSVPTAQHLHSRLQSHETLLL